MQVKYRHSKAIIHTTRMYCDTFFCITYATTTYSHMYCLHSEITYTYRVGQKSGLQSKSSKQRFQSSVTPCEMKKSFNAHKQIRQRKCSVCFPSICNTSAEVLYFDNISLSWPHGEVEVIEPWEGCKGNISYSIWQTTASDITHIGQKES